MSSFDINQARQFIELLHGDIEQPLCWQVFWDDKTAGANDTLKQPTTFHAKVDDCVEYFNQIQSYNYGVYVTLNKTNGKGREETDIVGYSVIFADVDNMALPKMPLQPHFITQRDELHSHCYWKVKGIVTGDQFKRYQKQVAMYLGSDEQVVDPSRVVRVAGSCNMKNPASPAMYNIVKNYTQLVGKDHQYSLEDIDNAFKLTGEKLAKLDQWSDSRNSLDTGIGFNDDPINRSKFVNWLGRAEPAIEGSGTMTLIKVASMGYDLGIPLTEAQDLMWVHYDPRCFPTWSSTGEQRHFNAVVERAYKYANNVAGCRTASGIFEAAGEVPEPTGGWEHNATLGKTKGADKTPTVEFDTTAISVNDGINLGDDTAFGSFLASLTNKSAVIDLARAFIGVNFPNGGLLRKEKVFYEFNGRCWQEISDDDIKSLIMLYFDQQQTWKFPPSKVNNILAFVENLAQTKNLNNNSWLNNEYDGDNTIVMKNTVVVIEDDGIKLVPHTRDFFTLNELDYDYDADAKCPEFEKFLGSIWEDKDLHMCLQENFGYSLTSDTSTHKMFVYVGKSRAGKSIITNLLTDLIGHKNAMSPSLETLSENSILHAMTKKRLITIPEATEVHPSKRYSVLGTLKSISGGDDISFHRMYKGEGTGKVTAKMHLTANTMPDFVDDSGALANRYIVFPFTRSFFGREDFTLADRLSGEKSGVFNWAIEGLRRLRSNGGKFTISKKSREMVEDMKRDMFPLADFCDEVCVIENDVEILSGDLYSAYQYFCKQRDIKHMSQNKFTKHLKSSYLAVNHGRIMYRDEDGKSKQGRGFKGIRLNEKHDYLLNKDTAGKVIPFTAVTDGAADNKPTAIVAPPTPIKQG